MTLSPLASSLAKNIKLHNPTYSHPSSFGRISFGTPSSPIHNQHKIAIEDFATGSTQYPEALQEQESIKVNLFWADYFKKNPGEFDKEVKKSLASEEEKAKLAKDENGLEDPEKADALLENNLRMTLKNHREKVTK